MTSPGAALPPPRPQPAERPSCPATQALNPTARGLPAHTLLLQGAMPRPKSYSKALPCLPLLLYSLLYLTHDLLGFPPTSSSSCCPLFQPTRPDVRLLPEVLRLGAMPRSRSHRSITLHPLLVTAGRALHPADEGLPAYQGPALLPSPSPRPTELPLRRRDSGRPPSFLLPSGVPCGGLPGLYRLDGCCGRTCVDLIIVITTVKKVSLCFPPCGSC